MPWSLKPKNTEAEATLKTKNAESVATLKTRIPQEGDILFIVTPLGDHILVGEDEDEDLIYQEAYNNWNLKTKIES